MQNYSNGLPARQPAVTVDEIHSGGAMPRQNWAGEVVYQPIGYNNDMLPGLIPGGVSGYSAYSGVQDPDAQTGSGMAAVGQELALSGSPLPQAGKLQMSSGLPEETVEDPVTVEEAYRGSLRALLAQNLGHYVVATFLVGTQNPVSWEGFLHSVGNDYLVLFQPDQGRFITGDFYSLKFVEFHDTAGVKPTCPGYRRRDGSRIW